MYTQLKRFCIAHIWFVIAGMLLLLCLIYTIIFSTGVLLYPTLYHEQWLLQRPLTAVDCMFREWRRLGEAQYSLFFTLLLAGGCLLLGYRKRVLPYIFLLLLIGIGIEFVGKQYFPQPIPDSLRLGLNALYCPQIASQSSSVKLLVAVGVWWKAPPPSPQRLANKHYGATTAFVVDEETSPDYGYPSGHAIRWMFLGLIACWLAWRHVRYRLLRASLIIIALAIAFGGGFGQYYTGVHLITDLMAGYLIGASSACLAIGLLSRNYARKDTVAPAVGASKNTAGMLSLRRGS